MIANIPNERGNVLDKVRWAALMEIGNNAAYYATLPPDDLIGKYQLNKLKLMVLIDKLARRNRPLATFILLQSAVLLQPYIKNAGKEGFENYEPKRGRNQKQVFPIKLIMHLLNCSRRTACTYQLALKGMEMETELWNSALYALTVGPPAKKEASP